MIEERLRQLASELSASSFDPKYAEDLLELVNHGEPTIGMEILLDNLFDDEVDLPPTMIVEILELGRLVRADPERCDNFAQKFHIRN